MNDLNLESVIISFLLGMTIVFNQYQLKYLLQINILIIYLIINYDFPIILAHQINGC